jgi:hypothetical protein
LANVGHHAIPFPDDWNDATASWKEIRDPAKDLPRSGARFLKPPAAPRMSRGDTLNAT